MSCQVVKEWLTFKSMSYVFCPCRDEIDGRGRCVSSMHVPDQFGQPVLPLNVRLLLKNINVLFSSIPNCCRCINKITDSLWPLFSFCFPLPHTKLLGHDDKVKLGTFLCTLLSQPNQIFFLKNVQNYDVPWVRYA